MKTQCGGSSCLPEFDNCLSIECITAKIIKAISGQQHALAHLLKAESLKIRSVTNSDANLNQFIGVRESVNNTAKSAASFICVLDNEIRMMTDCGFEDNETDCAAICECTHRALSSVAASIADLENGMSEILDAYRCEDSSGVGTENGLEEITTKNRSVNDIILSANLIESSLAGELCCAIKYLTGSLENCGCDGVHDA
ncbi:MAG: hypothetical protein LBD16_05135 [Oscillospiraceae bacterium]|nr:hypothetical protein [Oscillospiraceae bacterium]